MSRERIALYPGTFDPITNGHLDILRRAATAFDRVVVGIGHNSKKQTMFSEQERLDIITESIADISGASVEVYQGLTVDYAQRIGATVIVRGLRTVADFEYEYQIALMNRSMAEDIDTVFYLPHANYAFLTSTIVRELIRHGRDVGEFVPTAVTKRLPRT